MEGIFRNFKFFDNIRGGASQRYGVIPDIITIGKSIGGGIPIGAVGMSEKIANLVGQGIFYLYLIFNYSKVSLLLTELSMEILYQ